MLDAITRPRATARMAAWAPSWRSTVTPTSIALERELVNGVVLDAAVLKR